MPLDISINDWIPDAVFVNYIVDIFQDNPNVGFRNLGTSINLTKFMKAVEISESIWRQDPETRKSKLLLFVMERKNMQEDAQQLAYSMTSKKNKSDIMKDKWTILILNGTNALVLATNCKHNIVNPTSFREINHVFHYFGRMGDSEGMKKNEEEIEEELDAKCCVVCLEKKRGLYPCLHCSTFYCVGCMEIMSNAKVAREQGGVAAVNKKKKKYATKKQKLMNIDCCVCAKKISVKQINGTSLEIHYSETSIMWMKEGAMLHFLKKHEGIELDRSVFEPEFNRAKFKDELMLKVPEEILQKYVKLPAFFEGYQVQG